MGNRVELTTYKMIETATGKESYGFTLYDDYAYMVDTQLAEEDVVTDIPLLLLTVSENIAIEHLDILDTMKAKGCTINGEYYDRIQMAQFLVNIT